MNETIVIDIETENTGYDVMGDNKRILSVQTYDGNESLIYYDGSDKNDLSSAKRFLEEQIGVGTKFVGFNFFRNGNIDRCFIPFCTEQRV